MTTTDTAELAFELRDALGPIYRRLIAEKSLSLGQSRALNRLSNHGPATSSALAASERITPQSMAVIVADLERAGQVSKTPDPADGRRMIIEITAAGRAAVDADRHATNTWLASAVGTLDEHDRATLQGAIDVLRRLGSA
ncbi:MarR family winged helix-turn-helix transcriptional regulator [Cellulomonas sp. URHE0023]|uniref:MarR family winged helix-turn-helix transcriptional regulator n=1 Tax=Cellulomonas sp. URHE0023 TaxID=1380354 RepID=UPI0004865009|nr:MarR family winged helix-turn-helix transcriptional regulator [Cellulomonas sp. URHE0023]